MPAWWIEKPYPKSTTSQDLIGKTLVLDPDRPPENTSFAGMKMVFVKVVNEKQEPKHWRTYKVMMTERDISTAIGCMEQKTTFTFAKQKDAKYAEVVIS